MTREKKERKKKKKNKCEAHTVNRLTLESVMNYISHGLQ